MRRIALKQTMKHWQTPAVVALVGAALVGCGVPEGGAGSFGEKAEAKPATGVQASVAEQMVAANATADRQMRLIARKYLNNGTEVAEFYEPIAGQILFSAAGSPKAGSVLRREQIEGKTASEVWAVVAPGETMPQALAAAIERSRNPVSESDGVDLHRTLPEMSQSAGQAAASKRTERITPFASGYCSGQFWNDWGNWGAGSPRNSQTLNWGYNWQSWSNVTNTAGFIVCPQGNVSGKGGRLTINFPNGSSAWEVSPNYYRWATSTAGADCGWDIRCWGTRCTPNPFSISGRYDSDCFLQYNNSCGDNYDWITFASSQDSYCTRNLGGVPPGQPGTCNLTCYQNCGNGCLPMGGATWCSPADANAHAGPGCGVCCDPYCTSATCP